MAREESLESAWGFLRLGIHHAKEMAECIDDLYTDAPEASNNDVKELRAGIVGHAKRIMKQVSFIRARDRIPTREHCFRLTNMLKDLTDKLGPFSNNDPADEKTSRDLLDFLAEWGYVFDRLWFLLAIYDGNAEALIRVLGESVNEPTLEQPEPPVSGRVPEEQAAEEQTAEEQTEALHLEIAERDRLFSKLRNAKRFSQSLMDCIGVSDLQTGGQRPTTPLIFGRKNVDKNDYEMEDEPVIDEVMSSAPQPEVSHMSEYASLRQFLIDRALYLAPDKLEIAQALADAVHGLHVCDVRHGSIMPDCVLITPEMEALLHGFICHPSDSWGWKSPTSNETVSFDRYYQMAQNMQKSMSDDIYNLGICLLEVGEFWSSIKLEEERPEHGEDGDRKPGVLGAIWFKDPDLELPAREAKKKLLEKVDANLTELGHHYIRAARNCLQVRQQGFAERSPDSKVDFAIWFLDNVLLELRKVDIDREGFVDNDDIEFVDE